MSERARRNATGAKARVKPPVRSAKQPPPEEPGFAPLGRWEYRADDGTTVWSEEECRIYGLGPGAKSPAYEVLLERHIHPDDAQKLDRAFGEALRTGSVFELEHRIVRPDGDIRFLYNVAFPDIDGRGRPVRYMGVTLDVTERKRAEEALRRSEERLRLAQVSAGAGTWDWDLSTERLEWSPELYRLFGLDPERSESVFDSWRSILHPEDREQAERRIETAIARHEPLNSEYRIVLPSGEVRWINALGDTVYDASGTPARMMGICIDITERKRTEARLRESENRFRLVAESLPQLVWTCRPDGPCDYLSPQWVAYTGVPEAHQLGYGWLDRLHPDDRERTIAAWLDTAARGVNFSVEFRIRRHDGAYRLFRTLAVPLRDEAGTIVKWFGSNTDIQDIREAEALNRALADQERLRLAVEQASDAVVMIDLDGAIRYVNAAFESISGILRDEAVRRSYFALLGRDAVLAGTIRAAISEGRPWHGPVTRDGPGGKPVELEVTISPAKDATGSIVGGLVTERDVTKEIALQRQFRQAQKMEALGTLAGGISHDFNNILSAIIVNTELGQLEIDPAHPAREPLASVLQAANRGKEMIKQIITFSRHKAWERVPVEIAPIVREGLRFMLAALPKNCTIHRAIDPACGVVMADPSHIHQVLANICQNAAMALGDRGGDIEVRLEPVEVDRTLAERHPDLKPGPYVRLTIADTGEGMTSEVMERIFEPFFTTRGPGKGSGLGLAVVHGIVRTYDGVVTVYSEPGRGSTFNVFLPRLTGPPRPAETSPQAEPAGGQERILLVEDEKDQRESLSRSLDRLGYRVTAATDGHSALSIFRGDPAAFDLVITDQIMPRMSGLELAAEIAALRPGLPVILCTGFSDRLDGGIVGTSGIRELVMKPFSLRDITRTIRKVAS